MFISEVRVKNFRSIMDETLPCDSLTALVGRNGSGKSSFLTALELFYDPSAKITAEDFYAEDTTAEIEIAVTFTGLEPDAKDLFSTYMHDEVLTVVRVFSENQGRKSGAYFGTRSQNPDFLHVRNAGGSRDIRAKYQEIRGSAEYSSLPSVRSADEALKMLSEWETRNPGRCSPLRDDGQFFGFTQVAQGYLGRHTRFIHIPAVRDAQVDATESRGSCVTEIMDLVVRNALATRKDLADFRQQTQDQFRDIMDPKKFAELNDLEHVLSDTLQSYVPSANVLLRWSALPDISIPLPQAQVKLLEDGYESAVERTGHGLQRAFIVTMLQHLVAARGAAAGSEDETEDTTAEIGAPQLPSLVLAIEEPELYQHPSSQRHLASVLLNLATGTIPGVAKNTQVVYTTHSPLFVGLERFEQIRVLRKTARAGGKPKVTQLRKADMEAVADELWGAMGSTGPRYKAATLRPRLQAIMTPWMSEGFFAEVVVLVEGEDDRAAILGVAKSKNRDFDSLGITVIPCFGKANLDRPLVIFRQLGVPVYVVWDGDCDGKRTTAEANRYLLRLLNEPEEDWPDSVESTCATFKFDLESTLESEIGSALFKQLLSKAQTDLGIVKKNQALKNSAVIQQVIESAHLSGHKSRSLEQVVANVIALKSQTAVRTPVVI